ncbi:MAG: hypothetical protein AAGI11_01455 [Pseudomonadota bacterium]
MLIYLAAALMLACEPVEPVVTFEEGTFEGFDVISYVPDEPIGLVFFFHGSGGSAGFATRIETLDVINLLIQRGYGFIATESTQRTSPRRWRVNDPSLSDNDDLARLVRLHDHVVRSSPVTAQTPLFGVGMSNGARMVSLFGQSFSDAGYPIAAIVSVMGTVATPVRQAGGLTVPTLFIIAENDTVVPNAQILRDRDQTMANGVTTALLTKDEELLVDWRFTRIPSINADDALAIIEAAVMTGAWNSEGIRQVPVSSAQLLLRESRLPASVSGDVNEVLAQFGNILAVHQFSALYREQIADFFDGQNALFPMALTP